MRTEPPQSPRTPEPAPRRTAAAAAALAATPNAPKPGASSCAFAALLLAANAGHEAQAQAPSTQADTEAGPDPERTRGNTGDATAAAPEPPRVNPAESAAFIASLEAKTNAATASRATPATPTTLATADSQAASATPATPATPASAAGTEDATTRKAAAAQAPAAWVSTLAKARATTGPATGTTAAPKLGVDLLAPSAHFLVATGHAAAAALRFAAPVAGPAVATANHTLISADAAAWADEPSASALATLSASARSDAGSGEGSGQGARGGAGTQAWVDSPAPSVGANEASAVGSDFGQLLEQQVAGQGLEAVLEPLNQHISLWLAGQVKRANLVLHEGLGQPLEIGLQLDGNQARLDFLTDDAALLEALQAQAPEALSELLGQSGLELVGLSIGSRASGQSDRSAQPRPEWAQPPRSEGAEQADPAAQAPTLQWQLGAGGAGLSVYA